MKLALGDRIKITMTEFLRVFLIAFLFALLLAVGFYLPLYRAVRGTKKN